MPAVRFLTGLRAASLGQSRHLYGSLISTRHLPANMPGGAGNVNGAVVSKKIQMKVQEAS
jgi:hypothetical protein